MSEPTNNLSELIERAHRPIALDAFTKDAPARLFFGGSFDPPHLAHTLLADQAASKLETTMGLMPNSCHLVYVPASRSPHKDTDPTPDQHRVEMIRRAINTLESTGRPASIWTQELSDGLLNDDQPSYWADTWLIAHQMLTSGINRFLIGADQTRSMHRWRRYEEFWRDAVVMLRGDTESDHSATDLIQPLINDLKQLEVYRTDDIHHWQQSCIELDTLPYSSTSIREQLAQLDRSTNEKPRIEGIDPGVLEYILSNGLYK